MPVRFLSILACAATSGCGGGTGVGSPSQAIETIVATSGTPQSANIGMSFAAPLIATVTTGQSPNSGVVVTFTAPATGASGTFATTPPSTIATVTTSPSGVAQSPVFAANTTAGGPYTVTATVAGVAAAASFSLTNTPPGQITVTVAPISFPLGVGSNYQFSATVTGSTNTAVSWQVSGVAGGNATVGTIDSTGLYIAPGAIPNQSILITAVAQADGVSNGSAPVTLSLTDPLGTGAGTATADTIPCPTVAGVTPGTCYSVALSCPGVSTLNGYLWVNMPSGTPIGTVLLTGGANSEGLYADPTVLTYGANVVNGLLSAGYITVQTSFGGVFTTTQPYGWQTGPGGLRRVACRYPTLVKWVQQNIAPSSAPMCATGTSAGAGLIGYAMAHYGGTSLFQMVEPTSGPPFSRLDYSCECNQPDLPDPCVAGQMLTQCVGPKNAQDYIDPAYAAPALCSSDENTHSTANAAQFLSDSILSPEATLTYPGTYVHFAWGGEDTTSAPVMGQLWEEVITPTSGTAYACVADAPHDMADVLDGAQQILTDLVNNCH